MDPRTRGEREYLALIGARPEEALAHVKASSPDMYDTITESAFGGPLAHAELGRQPREIATLAILAAGGGAEPQLASHVRAAVRRGASHQHRTTLA